MVNCEDLPLFPLHVVLFPDMPLPLHIFETRYRKMIRQCLGANQPFGIVLIQGGTEGSADAMPHPIGTTARITKYEELPDGRVNIVVVGESRFRIVEIFNNQAYLTARVEMLSEDVENDAADCLELASRLFKRYLRSLFALTNRRLSALQLPQEPEKLSYAIASAMQVPLSEKQRLLEMGSTQTRFKREIEVLEREIEAQEALRHESEIRSDHGVIQPVNTRELMLFTSRN